jgi:hypothetical protein
MKGKSIIDWMVLLSYIPMAFNNGVLTVNITALVDQLLSTSGELRNGGSMASVIASMDLLACGFVDPTSGGSTMCG